MDFERDQGIRCNPGTPPTQRWRTFGIHPKQEDTVAAILICGVGLAAIAVIVWMIIRFEREQRAQGESEPDGD